MDYYCVEGVMVVKNHMYTIVPIVKPLWYFIIQVYIINFNMINFSQCADNNLTYGAAFASFSYLLLLISTIQLVKPSLYTKLCMYVMYCT